MNLLWLLWGCIWLWQRGLSHFASASYSNLHSFSNAKDVIADSSNSSDKYVVTQYYTSVDCQAGSESVAQGFVLDVCFEEDALFTTISNSTSYTCKDGIPVISSYKTSDCSGVPVVTVLNKIPGTCESTLNSGYGLSGIITCSDNIPSFAESVEFRFFDSDDTSECSQNDLIQFDVIKTNSCLEVSTNISIDMFCDEDVVVYSKYLNSNCAGLPIDLFEQGDSGCLDDEDFLLPIFNYLSGELVSINCFSNGTSLPSSSPSLSPSIQPTIVPIVAASVTQTIYQCSYSNYLLNQSVANLALISAISSSVSGLSNDNIVNLYGLELLGIQDSFNISYFIQTSSESLNFNVISNELLASLQNGNFNSNLQVNAEVYDATVLLQSYSSMNAIIVDMSSTSAPISSPSSTSTTSVSKEKIIGIAVAVGVSVFFILSLLLGAYYYYFISGMNVSIPADTNTKRIPPLKESDSSVSTSSSTMITSKKKKPIKLNRPRAVASTNPLAGTSFDDFDL